MRKSILLFVLFALLNIPLMLFAQGGYKVTGHVVSAEDNEPMIGVSILQKGTTNCLLYTSPSPRDAHESRMPSSA